MPLLTQKSQVTIPKKIREYLGVGPGDKVEFDVQDRHVVLHKQITPGIIDKYKGFLGKGKTEQVMKELR